MSNIQTSLELVPLTSSLGAEVRGVDLSKPLSQAAFDEIYAAFLEHQVLLFRDQNLPPAQHVAFARHFGEVQVHVMNQYHNAAHPELYTLSNLDADGKPSGNHPDQGTMAWHTDGSWQRVTGQATMLYAEVVPKAGGETHFCDMYGALEDLDLDTRARLEGLRAVHNLDFSRNRRHGHEPMSVEQRAAVPPVDHPIVRAHPDTKRPCIYLGDHAEHVLDMDYAAGRELIDGLNHRIINPERCYEHRYRPGDLVIWDNRCVLHRATGYDTANEPRVMRRCTVLGEVPQAAMS